jgi:hypothetical protein
MKFIISRRLCILQKRAARTISRTAVVFSRINENLTFFKNCHQRLCPFWCKTHKFLILVGRKKRESRDSLDSSLCFDGRLSKKKISDNLREKK